MIEYITVEEVDALLGSSWSAADKKDEAVLIANVWMTNQQLPDTDPMPEEWKRAAAYVAREAAKGGIYGQAEYGLMSKSVQAGDVSSSKTFASNHKIVSAGESLALALLKPWLGGLGGGVFMLKRI
ncbi:hypothetical protein [Pusillimonas noertemannii]|uniref:Protein singed n=1 Tax=Pusillimonas noertemannii TaxID=305977 RepID=A0A2U1CRX8_9BURK|nr:hypothetical protein [Pusillimonas noertemannii]NYT67972.1 hypothetical protein [Pusillimonas noertemannii]PVY68646.1 hypothetical protein C7440_1057 [Pusillimonas noertemannii]TFL11887.1 hypothetical protein CSC72_01790 [Pusillimonas noertemannii]